MREKERDADRTIDRVKVSESRLKRLFRMNVGGSDMHRMTDNHAIHSK